LSYRQTWGRRKRSIEADFNDNLEFNANYGNEIYSDAYENREDYSHSSYLSPTHEDEMTDQDFNDFIQADADAAASIQEIQDDDAQPNGNDESENMHSQIQKRFFFTKVYYWQICSSKEAWFCATYPVPNPKDHSMDNYVKSIKDVTLYRTLKSKEKSNLGIALVDSCNGK